MIATTATNSLSRIQDEDKYYSDKLAELMLWSVENQTIAKAIIQQGHIEVKKYRWESIKDKLYDTYGFSS